MEFGHSSIMVFSFKINKLIALRAVDLVKVVPKTDTGHLLQIFTGAVVAQF